MNAYQSCLKVALFDTAHRLSYLGYHGDALCEFLQYMLSIEGQDAYQYVVDASDAAGYCPIADRKSWAGRGLPDSAGLTGLPAALELLVARYAPDGGHDPVAPFGKPAEGLSGDS